MQGQGPQIALQVPIKDTTRHGNTQNESRHKQSIAAICRRILDENRRLIGPFVEGVLCGRVPNESTGLPRPCQELFQYRY